jgi:hypothetical protein
MYQGATATMASAPREKWGAKQLVVDNCALR